MTSAGIYVHWAFCPYICPYCDFAKWPFDERAAERYVSALEAEIARAPAVAATTVFYGGGTPNANSTPQLVRVLDLVRERFGVRADAEISIEVNPDRELTAHFEPLRRSGFTRMSIGAQSFEAPELRVLGRRHSAADVAETVRRARAAGFGNVNIDLMFGVPGQTEASWERSLEAAIALGVEHVSTYGLTIEEGTPYAGWQAREPAAFADDEREAEMYQLAIEKLTAAGFEHYEISNFRETRRFAASTMPTTGATEPIWASAPVRPRIWTASARPTPVTARRTRRPRWPAKRSQAIPRNS